MSNDLSIPRDFVSDSKYVFCKFKSGKEDVFSPDIPVVKTTPSMISIYNKSEWSALSKALSEASFVASSNKHSNDKLRFVKIAAHLCE